MAEPRDDARAAAFSYCGPTACLQLIMAAMGCGTPGHDGIQATYEAYQLGRMTPDEERQYVQDVEAGLMILPPSAVLGAH